MNKYDDDDVVVTPPSAEECSIVMSMSACVSVCLSVWNYMFNLRRLCARYSGRRSSDSGEVMKQSNDA